MLLFGTLGDSEMFTKQTLNTSQVIRPELKQFSDQKPSKLQLAGN